MPLTLMETNEISVVTAWMKAVSHENVSIKKVQRRLTKIGAEMALVLIFQTSLRTMGK